MEIVTPIMYWMILIAGKGSNHSYIMHTNETSEWDRVAAAPPFPGLRRFPQGRRFKQWTGDDSKALMKVHMHILTQCHFPHEYDIQVYLNAILGHVPTDMVQCIAAFLDACYLIRRADINESNITELQLAIRRYHEHRETFRVHAVRSKGFNLPRQHSLTHYPHQIREFGAPAGLCSSITKSRHITAVKRPWRRSNRHNALGQMLLTNQCVDKLTAAHNNFVHRGLLPPSHAPHPKPVLMPEEDKDGGPIDEHVTGTVTLARTRRTPKVLSLMGYVDFGHQNERLLAILKDLPPILTDPILSNSRAASFMTKCILMAHQQIKWRWKSARRSTQKFPYSVRQPQPFMPQVMNLAFEECGVSAYAQHIAGGTVDHGVIVHWSSKTRPSLG